VNSSTVSCPLCCWEDAGPVTSSGVEPWPGQQRERPPSCPWSASLQKLPAGPCPASYVLIPPDKHKLYVYILYNTLHFKSLRSIRFCNVFERSLLCSARLLYWYSKTVILWNIITKTVINCNQCWKLWKLVSAME